MGGGGGGGGGGGWGWGGVAQVPFLLFTWGVHTWRYTLYMLQANTHGYL